MRRSPFVPLSRLLSAALVGGLLMVPLALSGCGDGVEDGETLPVDDVEEYPEDYGSDFTN